MDPLGDRVLAEKGKKGRLKRGYEITSWFSVPVQDSTGGALLCQPVRRPMDPCYHATVTAFFFLALLFVHTRSHIITTERGIDIRGKKKRGPFDA